MSGDHGAPRVSRFGWNDAGKRNAPAVLVASGDSQVRARWMEGLHASYPVREVTRREALESTIAALAPDVLLLDLGLLKLGGIGDGPVIRSLSRQTLVVLMSDAPNEREGIRVLKAGARGYCQKTFEARVLCKAVDRVRDGEIWAERKLIARLLEEYSSDPSHNADLSVKSDDRLNLLTPREREIASLIAGGASNKEIASRLRVGEGTVKAHLTGVFRKLGFTDRLQLGLFLVNPSLQHPSLGR